ncbi:MAG TPA: hypothetical protein VHO25_03155, partial [Polyangiaceae bacterium]|nr:hypothetical protein [Polyangiaceae bacterium]
MIRFALLVSLLLLACSQGPKDAAPRSMAPSKLGVRQVPLSILVAEDYGGSRFKIDAGTVDAGPTANEFRLALNIPSVLRNRNGNGVHLWVMGSNEKVDVLAQPLPTDFVVYTPWFSGRTASIVFETDPGINLTELELPIRVTGVEFHEEASGNDPVQLQPGRAMHGWIGQGMRARKYKLPLGMSTLYVDMLQCGCAEPRLTLSERGPAGQQTTILEPAAGDHNVLKVVNATADSTLTVEYGVGHGCYTIVAAPLRYAFSLTTDISALAWDQPIIQQETGELFAHTAAKLLTATDGRALLTGGEFGSMIPGLILGGFIFTFPALLPDLILRTGSNTSHAAPLLGIALYEKESVERRSQTLVHEMGHYFWLMLNEKSCPISLMADSSRSEFCALPDHVSNPSVPPAGQWAWLAAHFGEPGKQLWSASLVKYQSIEHALLATLSFVGCPSCSSATVRAVDFPKAVDVNHNGINDCREADSDGDGV